MDLNERFNVLKQAAQIAQSKGVLTLDDAVYVKSAIDNINTNPEVAAQILIQILQTAQSKGAFSLKDAYIIYIAIDGIVDELSKLKEVPVESKEEEKTENPNENKDE